VTERFKKAFWGQMDLWKEGKKFMAQPMRY
jgi:hypothetical protein